MIRFFLKSQFNHEATMPKDIKRDNRRLILSLMDYDCAFSASEISAKSGLSKTTISKMLLEFCEIGLINYVGKGSSTTDGGKKPDLFKINSEYRYALVVQLAEPNYISCSIVDLACEIVHSVSQDTDPQISYPDAIKLVSKLVNKLLKKTSISSSRICGVAVSCDGIVDTENRIILRPAHHAWPNNLPVGEDIQKNLGFEAPVSIDNVCRYGGYAELLFPKNRHYSNMVVIWNDDFVGGCVLSGHELVQGHGGLVGEIGHMVMEADSDVRCSCGGYGCFEALVAQGRVVKRAYAEADKYPQSILIEKINEKILDITDIFDASNSGDQFAQILLDKVTGYYAILIHNITTLHDVQKVIVQGSYAMAGPYFYNSLAEHLTRYPLQKMIPDLVISASDYTNKNRIIGAGFHVITKFFDSDKYCTKIP